MPWSQVTARGLIIRVAADFRCLRRSGSLPRNASQTDARTEARDAHARYFAGGSSWPSGTVRVSVRPTTVDCRVGQSAYRISRSADHDDVDDAATIATYAAFLGFVSETYEPIARAEELIELLAPSTTLGSAPCMCWHLALLDAWSGRRVGPLQRRRPIGDRSRPPLCRSASTVGWAASRRPRAGQPNVGRVVPHPAGAGSRHPYHHQASLIFALTTARFADEGDGRLLMA